MACLALVVETCSGLKTVIPVLATVAAFDITSSAPARLTTCPISWRVGGRIRLRSTFYEDPDHPTEGKVRGNDTDMQLCIRPDGSDRIIVREISGCDPQRRSPNYSDCRGDQP